MRLLTVTHYFGSHGGGIERVAERLAVELAANGHRVSWLATDASPPSQGAAIETQALRAGHWVERKLGVPFPIPAPGELRKLFRAVADAEAVLIHDCLYLSNIAAFLMAKRMCKPVLIVQHVGDVPYRNAALRMAMKLANRVVTRSLLARADQVVFISELTRRQFANVPYRRPPVLAFNGVDSSIFRLATDTPNAVLRDQFGLRATDKLIVFAGRFVEKKGLETIRLLASQRPNLTFALAGHGPIDPTSWDLPNVRVLGQLTGPDLADLYRAGDLFLLPSSGEGFPLVVQEALACGLPVLCGADTADADAEARRFLTGATVDPANPSVTSANFLEALDKEIERDRTDEERSQRSRFAIDRYSWPQLGQTYSRLLHAIATMQDAPGTPQQVGRGAATS